MRNLNWGWQSAMVFLASCSVACSDSSDSEPMDGQRPAVGSGGGAAILLPGPDAGGGSSMGQAGARMSADAGTAAVVGASSDDQEPTDPLALPAGCPTIRALPISGQDWAIVAVNIRDREVIFQNVSAAEQTLTTEHQWCLPTDYERLIPLDLDNPGDLRARVFKVGEIIRVPLVRADEDVIDIDSAGGEMGLYPAYGTFDESDKIMAFVSWGTGQPLGLISRAAIAAPAGLWSVGDHVPVAAGHVGIVAIGATDVSEGYVSVPLNCYPQ